MPPIGELPILVPVDVSESEAPDLGVLDLLRPYEVVLIVYFPVPDQAEPALIRGEYEDEVSAILDVIEGYDTVCIGLAHRTDESGVVFGAITEQVSRQASGNVALIREAEDKTGS